MTQRKSRGKRRSKKIDLNFFIVGILMICILIPLFSSCDGGYRKKLMGIWTVDKAVKENQEYLFLSNFMQFDKKGTCSLPRSNMQEGKKGKWEIVKKDSLLTLTVSVKNNGLSGVYNLNFKKDYENKLLKAILIRDDGLQVVCSKMLHSFE